MVPGPSKGGRAFVVLGKIRALTSKVPSIVQALGDKARSGVRVKALSASRSASLVAVVSPSMGMSAALLKIA